MKICRKCGIEKGISEFYVRKSNSDGLYSYCKDCSRKDCREKHHKYREERLEAQSEYRKKNRVFLNDKSKKYYWEHRERVLDKVEIYRNKNKEKISIREALSRKNDADRFDKNRKKHNEWAKKNREHLNEYQKKWYQKNKEKRKAHVILKRAIESGKIVRPLECSQCFQTCKPDGHHEDYNFPLNVIWLCKVCHSRKSPRAVLK